MRHGGTRQSRRPPPSAVAAHCRPVHSGGSCLLFAVGIFTACFYAAAGLLRELAAVHIPHQATAVSEKGLLAERLLATD